ncbi:hypothetical protein MXMO3_03695 (plasmid) [Maritalea myrionectae]|uniref:Uncharacterized protein n=1 Tax=Maritalea myrionectae TaxID=454601 RepID=A0A2R4MJR3_9HYPH|nr:hypothetical protein MXMO3_03695 [Maritalea myrionectae]
MANQIYEFKTQIGQMCFVSKSVMTGIMNALAILIFMAPLPELHPGKVPPLTHFGAALGLAIIYLFARFTKGLLFVAPEKFLN